MLLKREEPEISCYDTNVMDELQRFYEQTVDKLCGRNFDSASALVHEANRIFTYASGYVQNNVVQELKRLFSTITSCSTTYRHGKSSATSSGP